MDHNTHIANTIEAVTIEPKPGGGFIARFVNRPLVVEADTREALAAKISEAGRAFKGSLLQQGFMPADKDGKWFVKESETDLPFGPSVSKAESVFRSLAFALERMHRVSPKVNLLWKISLAPVVLFILWFAAKNDLLWLTVAVFFLQWFFRWAEDEK